MWGFFRAFLRRIATDNISFLAGGVAFYGLLSVFPAIAALVSLFGLGADPHVVREQLERMQDLFPPDVFRLIHSQVLILVDQPVSTLSITAVIGILLTVSSATRGTKAMLAALNMVFRIPESRGWWRRQVISYIMTLGGIIILILAIFIIVALPLLVKFLSPDIAEMIAAPMAAMRWIVLGAAVWAGVLLLFILGPSRHLRDQSFGHDIIGATTATVLWLASAFGLSWFVQKVPNFHAAYGSLSAVIVLMLWMVLSAYAVLIGAAVTATFDRSEDKSLLHKLSDAIAE